MRVLSDVRATMTSPSVNESVYNLACSTSSRGDLACCGFGRESHSSV
jgi:hypothetical protein